MVIPPLPAHTHTHAEPQPNNNKKTHLLFSLKVKAGFIHFLEDKEFAVLILDVSVASASLLPEK